MQNLFSTRSQPNTLRIGGREFDLRGLIILGGNTGPGSNLNTTLRKLNANPISAGYAVTAGKTLTIHAIVFVNLTTTAANCTGPLQSDNDVGLGTATAFTNPVYPGGNANIPAVIAPPTTSSGANPAGHAIYHVNFPILAGKFCSVIGNATSGIVAIAYGYEN